MDGIILRSSKDDCNEALIPAVVLAPDPTSCRFNFTNSTSLVITL
eukprot:CAMPEP_0118721428 /NCGR_PEP_ID=MMETSP0800-20121206/30724_1 /TAXON_ID=210618 ORGANISM="Striatella unipunctata, Strain CCMP2910" /NCGR_SAMPLE_ID=MMETSP0800 /ASSEMBLY_ACC=CAM_ASM_000638 /LENGTH=44 /DNA_ID= /DNA_START= /DNA_END= /DNA_ORIENTATION=